MPDVRDAILFLCVANSARSQMAEALARRAAPDGVHVFSAGSSPATINPFAVRALGEIGLDASAQCAKGLDDIPRERIRVAVTLCADEVCPKFLGDERPGEVMRLHWPHDDPAGCTDGDVASLALFRRVRDELGKCIDAFFAGGWLEGAAPNGGGAAPSLDASSPSLNAP